MLNIAAMNASTAVLGSLVLRPKLFVLTIIVNGPMLSTDNEI